MLHVTLQWTSIPSGGSRSTLDASCYRNLDKLYGQLAWLRPHLLPYRKQLVLFPLKPQCSLACAASVPVWTAFSAFLACTNWNESKKIDKAGGGVPLLTPPPPALSFFSSRSNLRMARMWKKPFVWERLLRRLSAPKWFCHWGNNTKPWPENAQY